MKVLLDMCHNLQHGNKNSKPVVVIVISLAFYFFTNDPKDISSFYIVLLFSFQLNIKLFRDIVRVNIIKRWALLGSDIFVNFYP